MSAVAVSSSSLNPDAPLFIPAALLQVEDFSPQWWDLVTTTAWFRDHWSREHTQLDEMAQELDAAGLLPDDDEDLFYDDQPEHAPAAVTCRADAAALCAACDADIHSANPLARRHERLPVAPFFGALADAPRGFREKPRHAEKPTKYAGSPKGSSAPRMIHQPR